MSGFTLTLRSQPSERLDLAGLTPDALKGMTAGQIAHMVIGTSKAPATMGDVFKISGGSGDTLRIEGDSDRLDFVGAKLAEGTIVVEGDVGAYAAAEMRGGRLDIRGNAGLGLGAAMKGGVVHVTGSAGELTGGVRPGAQYGMQGGTIVVEGDIGERAGDRMRRGTIIARGQFGRWAGTRMMGGTLWTLGGFGDEPGLQMRRGTLIGPRVSRMLSTFGDGGLHNLTVLRILSRDTAHRLGALAPPPLPAKVRKYSGDLSIFGKGELLQPGDRTFDTRALVALSSRTCAVKIPTLAVGFEARVHLGQGRSMIAIIISACMIADPDICKDYKIPLMMDVDSRMCLVHAPPHFGKWASEHPGWRIVKWRCGAASDQDI